MSRSLGLAGAGVLLLAAAGCSFDSFLTPGLSLRQQQVVSAPLVRVSAQLQEGLSEAGIHVLSKPVGQEMRLAGMTKSKKVFCLHLYAEKEGKAERTLVRIKWDREADEAFWQTVVQIVTETAADPEEPEPNA